MGQQLFSFSRRLSKNKSVELEHWPNGEDCPFYFGLTLRHNRKGLQDHHGYELELSLGPLGSVALTFYDHRHSEYLNDIDKGWE
jgi:hypothetical protein